MKKYENLQRELEKAAKSNSREKLKTVLLNNKELILEIVNAYGSGSSYLLSPYNILYSHNNYDLSGFYQDTIEEINPIALLGEDQ